MNKFYHTAIFALAFILTSYSQNPQLWGLTSAGAGSSGGAIIKINGDGSGFASPYSFAAEYPGANPYGNLLQASNGLLYGMTLGVGSYNEGVIFSYNPNTAVYTDVFNFDNSSGSPEGSLVQASNGLLYGMTSNGGRQ